MGFHVGHVHALLDPVLLALVQADLGIVDHLQLPHAKAPLQGRHELERQLQLLACRLVEDLDVVDALHVRAVEQRQEALRVLRHAEEGHRLDDHSRELRLLLVGLLLLVLRGGHEARGHRPREVHVASRRGGAMPVPAAGALGRLQLALRLQAVAVHILDALDVEDEGELRDDVQERPAELDDENIGDEPQPLGRDEVPNGERRPSGDQQDRCLAEFRVALEHTLLPIAVLDDLQTIEIDHGQEQGARQQEARDLDA
mmetsp:Transcript_126013/g.364623  ORF Transcript_126013/g.364623 Transcript_126013/m.364623 type:complete len:257 (-) Transcript_126013:548-1318(-)